MDKYLSVDETKAGLLQSFGDDTVTTETVYEFNAEVLQRCGEAVSTAIMNCPDISDEDKANLIVAKQKQTVAKGLVDKLLQYPNWKDLVEVAAPIIQIKNSR
jgi:hypothetical protein